MPGFLGCRAIRLCQKPRNVLPPTINRFDEDDQPRLSKSETVHDNDDERSSLCMSA